MISVRETIVVEGVYDKIKISQYVDGIIFVTGGFSIMKDAKKVKSLKMLAEKTGIVILTDSDSAGFRIRNFLKQQLPDDKVKHAYIPEILGKERRKVMPGKEGLLGVEGMDGEVIIRALSEAGCQVDGNVELRERGRRITKADMYALGLSGGDKSAILRKKISYELGLPSKMSANMLLDVINRLISFEELEQMARELTED